MLQLFTSIFHWRFNCCQSLKEFYLYANVMDAPSLVLFQESSNRTLLAKWVKELELGVVEVDEHSGHAVLGQGLRQEGVSHNET